MSDKNPRLGILLMTATTFCFAVQDGISRVLAAEYSVIMTMMIRYWFLAPFVILFAMRSKGGLRKVLRPHHLWLQILRGLLLIGEMYLLIYAFTKLGLAESHAVFACNPLIIAALSGPLLGEHVGWRRWAAICVGFVGVMIILRPGFGVFSIYALFALASATLFALYGLLTRHVAKDDDWLTSFFWMGITGFVATTALGFGSLEPMSAPHVPWMIFLTVLGAFAHWLLIKTYDVSEASTVQPFSFLQLVFASAIGLLIFDETLQLNVMIGAALIVGAGLFTLWRQRAANP